MAFYSDIKRILSVGKKIPVANKQKNRLHMIRKLSSSDSSNLSSSIHESDKSL